MKTTLMVITVRYQQNVDSIYENNTVVMVITVRCQQNVDSVYENITIVMVHTVYEQKRAMYTETSQLPCYILSVICREQHNRQYYTPRRSKQALANLQKLTLRTAQLLGRNVWNSFLISRTV
jgi:hypothetical protein